MSAARPDQPLVPSVLDRLIDDAPESASEPARDRAQRLADLKLSVRRDVEDLLNTRRRAVVVPAHLKEAGRSLATYGLPDFSGAGPAAGKEREQFARRIERVLADGDPRLTQVSVEVVAADDTDRTLRFRISAMLRADPAPEPVSFDSTLEPATGSFAVRGEA